MERPFVRIRHRHHSDRDRPYRNEQARDNELRAIKTGALVLLELRDDIGLTKPDER